MRVGYVDLRLEADVCRGTETVGGGSLGRGVVFVGGDDRRTTVAQLTHEQPREGTQTTELTDDEAGGVEGVALVEDEPLAHLGHARARAALARQQPQQAQRIGPADTVGHQAGVALELGEGTCRERTHDSVGPSGAEAEVVQALLELEDVVTA
jgi:hypothetical protein